MGCNCGKKSAGTRSGLQASSVRFRVEHPDGATTQHRTRLEAEAENVRRGGKGRLKPVR